MMTPTETVAELRRLAHRIESAGMPDDCRLSLDLTMYGEDTLEQLQGFSGIMHRCRKNNAKGYHWITDASRDCIELTAFYDPQVLDWSHDDATELSLLDAEIDF